MGMGAVKRYHINMASNQTVEIYISTKWPLWFSLWVLNQDVMAGWWGDWRLHPHTKSFHPVFWLSTCWREIILSIGLIFAPITWECLHTREKCDAICFYCAQSHSIDLFHFGRNSLLAVAYSINSFWLQIGCSLLGKVWVFLELLFLLNTQAMNRTSTRLWLHSGFS
jgi:hypothetical protein